MPPLWVFTDRDRLPDPRGVLARLPKGLGGVVFRADGAGAATLAASVARLCRQRRLAMVVAGNPRMAAKLRVGQHLSRGRGGMVASRAWRTASAHGRREMARAGFAGVDGVFLSPVFPTASHPGAAALGPVRWAARARGAKGAVLALGGVTAATVRRLPRSCAGIGVVGAASGLAQAGLAR